MNKPLLAMLRKWWVFPDFISKSRLCFSQWWNQRYFDAKACDNSIINFVDNWKHQYRFIDMGVKHTFYYLLVECTRLEYRVRPHVHKFAPLIRMDFLYYYKLSLFAVSKLIIRAVGCLDNSNVAPELDIIGAAKGTQYDSWPYTVYLIGWVSDASKLNES